MVALYSELALPACLQAGPSLLNQQSDSGVLTPGSHSITPKEIYWRGELPRRAALRALSSSSFRRFPVNNLLNHVQETHDIGAGAGKPDSVRPGGI